MTTTGRAPVRLASPGEVAALVPHLLGFVPTESLVAVSLRGRRRRVGLTARIDLVDGEPGLRTVLQALRTDAPTSVLLVVHTAAPSGPDHPQAALVAAAARLLAEDGVALQEALLVRDGRWWSYLCEGPCCPTEGTPVPTGAGSVQRVAAEQALRGRAPLPDRAALVASVAPALPFGPALARHLQGQATRELAERVQEDPLAAARTEQERWRAAITGWTGRPGPQSPDRTAALVVGLHLPTVRDTVTAAGLDRGEPLLGLLLQLCRAAVPPDDAPLCAVLAAVAYLRGDGALALVALERALATDPELPLGSLLLQALDAAVPPDRLREVLAQAAAEVAAR